MTEQNTSQLSDLKKLMANAFAEAEAMSNCFCNVRGRLWWKTREHKWLHWRKEMVKSQHGELISFMYVRTCEHCGTEQYREQKIK